MSVSLSRRTSLVAANRALASQEMSLPRSASLPVAKENGDRESIDHYRRMKGHVRRVLHRRIKAAGVATSNADPPDNQCIVVHHFR